MRQRVFQSFWHGPALSPLERMCIQSFVEAGHEFRLYAYEAVDGVPPDCRVEDAGEVLPRERLFLHGDGIHGASIGAFSDAFRYRLLARVGGWWVDTDVLCVGTELPESDYVFAEQEPGVVNGAVLRAPPDSRLLEEACARIEDAGADTAFAAIGPKLLSELVSTLGLRAYAWPTPAVYPIGWAEALHVLDPDRHDEIVQRTRESHFVHFWSEILRLHNVLKTVRPPEGSFLAALYDRFGIDFPSAPRYDMSQLRPQIWLHERHLAMREELTRLHEQLGSGASSP